MESDSHELEPIEEEYENEDSLEISNSATVDATIELVQDTAINEDPNEKNVYKRKPRRKTSTVWNHFEQVEVCGVKKNQCKWCKSKFTISKSSCTSTLGRHLESCLKYAGSKKKQKVLSVDGKESGGVDIISNFQFDESKVRELLAHMILYHEYPFRIVEHVLFNKFMKACTPHWKKISRATAKSLCFATYEFEKKKLKTLLNRVPKVNITTDMWTSCQKVSYMVVTCHFIDSEWRLNRRVLNFCNIPPPHSGLLIADALHKCFRDWGIESKVCSITVDNAKANDVALRHLRDVFNMRKSLVVGGKLFHVRCCAHITNLMVQDGLSEIGDIVDCVRDGIKFLVASEGRLKQFTETAKNLHLSSKKLFLDVPTRWNSTYLMLSAAYEFKDVFSMYGYNDHQFIWVPSQEDWDKVKSVCELLGVFNRVTKIVSGSDYPTSNLFLPEIWRMKEVLINKCDDGNDYIRSMAHRMKAKFDKYWGECNLLMAIAAILDPRFKLEQDLASKVQESSSSNRSVFAVHDEEGGVEIWESFLKSAETVLQPMKSELEMYLEEGVYIPNKNIEFNALDWWKANTLKYNVLSKVAKDILSTPITTVTSESTFSAGGRVIDPHRASLSTETVQKLLCGADWVRSLYGLKKKCGDDQNEGEVEITLPEAI
ncbi:zinc finger BED domain-containing protein RICESLEEPER 2-like [Alnus glutinosa]|uniref:zinc finger BED domain-containing protein RICESLEEPER 2-like n=2 Tax=Alnus glutinosa TaxID=3517 RepID=UPI002D773626|nr:zinc finger BED domain-containing protein RICESLEEPER 2-like [Alnus glutinosa]